jgi:hypothetical protein
LFLPDTHYCDNSDSTPIVKPMTMVAMPALTATAAMVTLLTGKVHVLPTTTQREGKHATNEDPNFMAHQPWGSTLLMKAFIEPPATSTTMMAALGSEPVQL